MNGALFRKECRLQWKLVTLFLLVLTLYGGMIISMFDPRLGESLQAMAASMPDVFAAFGMDAAGATLTEFLANYLYGFLLVVFPMVLLLLLCHRLVARPMERGSMAYLLSCPSRRAQVILTQAAVLLLSLLAVALYVTGLYTALSAAMFPGELEVGRFLLLNTGLLGLYVFLSGVCFLAACLWGGGKLALGVGAGVCIASLLLQMVSRVGEKFEFLKYATPLTLFDPAALVAGEAWAVWGFLALYGAGALCYGLGAAVFCRRDLCI